MRDATINPQSEYVQPSNCWTRAEQCFYEALPHLQSFRDMVSADDIATARDRTFLETPRLPANSESYEFDVPLDAETMSAFGLVGSPLETPYQLVRSDTNAPEVNGVVIIQLQRQMAAHAKCDQEYFFHEARVAKNFAGCVMDDLWDYIRQQGGPWISSITCQVGPYRVHEEDAVTEGRWQACNLAIVWGLGAAQ